jgi:hypothetical protein
MSRWKAAAIHMSISATIGLVSAFLIFGVWYAPPYSEATGAGELVLLLMGVDLVLGPMLTLVVFKAGKRGLRFDLAIIALTQACAFTYGMSVVVSARPVFVVGAVDRFVLVLANDLDRADLAEASKPEFRHLSWTGPRIVGTVMPTDPEESNALLTSGLAGKDIERFPKYYVDYPLAATELLKRAKPLAELRKISVTAEPLIDRYLQEHHREIATVAWLPIKAPRASLTMLVDAATGTPIDALQLDPW